MLVEKKISSKINYDVLRDLDKAWLGNKEDDPLQNTAPVVGKLETSLHSADSGSLSSGSERLSSLRKRSVPLYSSSTLKQEPAAK